MHLVLRSTKATGDWSFRVAKHDKNIRRIIEEFAFVYGVRIVFIAMSVTGKTRWPEAAKKTQATNSAAETSNGKRLTRASEKFCDHRP